MKYFLFVGFLLISLIGCDSKSTVEKEIEAVPINFELDRFDREFASATPDNLSNLKAQYPMFFPKRFDDSIWLGRMQDTLQIQLHEEVDKVFKDNSQIVDELAPLFQHIKYYFPEFYTPRVYTTTSDVEYKNKIILIDSVLIIALDTYLGADHPFYEGIQKYTAKNMKRSQLTPDVASQYARKLISVPRKRNLLSQMIYSGKDLYLKDLWLPDVSDAEKIGYTEAEWTWAEENEIFIWQYFVENELLFSTDPKLPPRFINPAPFSKFYLEIDNESPGMIGRYIGWKIVRSFMAKNDFSVNRLMIETPEEIFKNSNYKPSK